MNTLFDIKKKCKDLKISPKILEKIENEIRKEFPTDEMMFELHVIRALMNYSKDNQEK